MTTKAKELIWEESERRAAAVAAYNTPMRSNKFNKNDRVLIKTGDYAGVKGNIMHCLFHHVTVRTENPNRWYTLDAKHVVKLRKVKKQKWPSPSHE